MIQRRQFLAGSCVGAFGLPGIAFAQNGYKSEYRLSLVVGPGTTWHAAAENFANLVRERTAGRINMKLYPGSSLVQGAQDRELAALRQGAIDVLVGTAVNWSGTVKDFTIFMLPYLMPDSRAVDAVLASEALNKDFYDIMRRSGVEPLASGEYGNIQLLNSKRRLAKPADIAGMKMRVVASPLQQDIMNAVKANPTSMSWADAQSALASGAVDGLTLTLEQAAAYKVPTLGLKFVTRWNAINELIHFTVANPVFKAWSPEDQQIVRAAAKEAAAELTLQVRKSAANDDALKPFGVDVYTPTPAELVEWKAAVRQPYEKWKASTNPGLLTKIEQVVAQSAKS
ncbi:TRAP transporter substrate-binding protein DctP [Hydrogenophaga sp.]|jgi:TRAP-type C4-dicarboxylate transport system substrate-binding protein|uniref:TRAP transporter substrate-binding protein DctP n=1 Tax=Hydrogenophaga sp. TaxID=1904254 RepID=UPI0035B3D3EE